MSFFKTVQHWFAEAPHFDGTITASERIGSRIQKITISFHAPVAMPFPVGCYVQAFAYGIIPRAYSVATATTTSFTILVSFSGMGAGARFFSEASIGTTVKCYGPFDDFPYRAGTGRPKIFFATSTGVSPFRRMVEEAITEDAEAVLILGTPKEADIAFKTDFESLELRYPRFHFIPTLSTTDPSWRGAHGYVTDQITNINLLKESDIYICGVPMMTAGVLAMMKNIGVPEEQIFVQKFG